MLGPAAGELLLAPALASGLEPVCCLVLLACSGRGEAAALDALLVAFALPFLAPPLGVLTCTGAAWLAVAVVVAVAVGACG